MLFRRTKFRFNQIEVESFDTQGTHIMFIESKLIARYRHIFISFSFRRYSLQEFVHACVAIHNLLTIFLSLRIQLATVHIRTDNVTFVRRNIPTTRDADIFRSRIESQKIVSFFVLSVVTSSFVFDIRHDDRRRWFMDGFVVFQHWPTVDQIVQVIDTRLLVCASVRFYFFGVCVCVAACYTCDDLFAVCLCGHAKLNSVYNNKNNIVDESKWHNRMVNRYLAFNIYSHARPIGRLAQVLSCVCWLVPTLFFFNDSHSLFRDSTRFASLSFLFFNSFYVIFILCVGFGEWGVDHFLSLRHISAPCVRDRDINLNSANLIRIHI